MSVRVTITAICRGDKGRMIVDLSEGFSKLKEQFERAGAIVIWTIEDVLP